MADFVLEVFIQVIVEAIPRYFGAFLKWIYLGFKIPYSEVFKQSGNTRIGAVSLGIIILVALLIIKFS